MRPARGWTSLVLEFLVVFVSILAAFGLESWWEGRKEAEDARQLRASLVADIRKNRVDVDSVLRQTVRTLEGASVLLRDLVVSDTGSPIDSIRARVAGLGQFRPLLTTMGAYNSAVGAGTLDLLEDPDLVVALADYVEYRRFLESNDRFAVELILDGRLSVTLERLGGLVRFASGLDGRDRDAILEVLREPGALAGIESIVFLQQTRVSVLVELRRRLDELLALLGEPPMTFDPIPLVDPPPPAADSDAGDADSTGDGTAPDPDVSPGGP